MSDSPIIQYPLRMRVCGSRVHEPAAWFIPGDRPEIWLAEMTGWNVSLADARLYPVPRSANDNSAIGLLVLLKSAPERSVRALPYGRVGDRLYLPADARLDPAPSMDELATHLRWEVQVLHPSAGLVGFSSDDALTVANLIAPPPQRSAAWDQARARPLLNDRLRSVRAEELPNIEQMIQAGRDDIGTETDEDVPTSPDETPMTDATRAAFTKAMLPFMSALHRVLAMGGQAPGKPGSMHRWASDKLAAMSAMLESHRFRELQRLMDLMSRDPDQGLQFALPLRDLPSRGIAPPSSTLGTRNVDFDLSSVLGGGSAGDSWNVPTDMRQNLRKQYRDAANRELNLGRFRRAAYIFAHLLGDFSASASALKRGRHFREAAAIYREKLKNNRAAADCLMEGGLLLEAIELYHELKMFEQAGDLYERLGDHAGAIEEWNAALQQLDDRQDVLAAAALLETKLQRPEEALRRLHFAWPNSDKAELCLIEWFNLAGRLGRHSEASVRILALRQQALPPYRYLAAVRTLARTASKYPNVDVRHQSADATRVIAGRRLQDATTDRRELVEQVLSLVPQDRLLDRDGNRFIAREKPRPRMLAVKGFTPPVVNQFQLQNGFNWVEVESIPNGFLALGISEGMNLLMLVRGNWKGQLGPASVALNSTCVSYLLLAPAEHRPALVAGYGAGRLLSQPLRLPRTDAFPRDLVAMHPAFVGPLLRGVCRDENGNTWSLIQSENDAATLGVYDHDKILGSYTINSPLDAAAIKLMAARRGIIYIADGNQLTMVKPGEAPTHVSLPAIARRMTPSPVYTVTRMLITFDDGGVIVRENGDYRLFGQSLISPVATYTPDGSLIAIGSGQGQIYPPETARKTSPVSFETTIAQPLAVLPAGNGEFAIIDPAGGVTIYRLPTA